MDLHAVAEVLRPRRRGGQPGHRGAYRARLPVEQVDEGVAVVPELCRSWRRPT